MPGEKPKPDRLDELIHQPTRLHIMAVLAGVESLSFNDLKAELSLTDGNLSTHASALEQAGYVTIEKTFRGRKPHTSIAITRKGRKAMRDYVQTLTNILGKADGTR